MAKPIVRTFFRPHDRVQEHGDLISFHGVLSKPVPRTKQEFIRECDVNNIIKSFSRPGMYKQMVEQANLGRYEDLPDNVDFQESLAVVEQARTSFMTLPAKVRARFENEPEQFLAFLHDKANEKEARDLGLLKPLPPPTPEAPPPPPTPSSKDPGTAPSNSSSPPSKP